MKNVTKATPDQMGYKDRGIIKWLGMMLSDHSEALKKDMRDSQLLEVKPKDRMSEIEIASMLYRAFSTGYPIAIQANILQNGNYFKDVNCKVQGYLENEICLLLQDGRTRHCKLEEIRNVEFMSTLEWYDKGEV